MSESKNEELVRFAERYLACGISVIPCGRIGETPYYPKKPNIKSWTPYKTALMNAEDVPTLFSGSENIAVICGRVSGNLEIIDVDSYKQVEGGSDVWQEYCALVNTEAPGLLDRCIVQRTPSGGYHVIYRTESEVPGNKKLANRPATEEELAIQPAARVKGLIETRGEGGYALVKPSTGYELMQGKWTSIPVLSSAERSVLFSAALVFNTYEDNSKVVGNDASIRSSAALRPGDDFNERGDHREVLQTLGWKFSRNGGDREFWTRPGKESGISASWNKKTRKFAVFTSSTEFESVLDNRTTYSLFGIIAQSQYAGNFKRAAQDLAAKGYGTKDPNYRREHYGDSDVPAGVDAQTGEILPKYHYTELGNAMRFVDRYRGEILFDHHGRQYYHWNGKQWLQDEVSDVYRLARELFKDLYDEAALCEGPKSSEECWKWAKQSEKKSIIENSLVLSRNGTALACTSDQFDKDPLLLNLNNGMYNLKEGVLYDHHPMLYQSKIVNIDFVDQAECPVWLDCLNTWFDGKVDVIEFVQRAVGYSLSGLLSEQCLLFAYGIGKNGKSVFFQVLERLLGDYFQKAPSDLIIARKNESGNSNDIARIRGTRLVVAQELPENKRFDESKIKDLTGDDKLVARFLRQEFFEFRPTHKLWIYGNHKPGIVGTDNGIWRRIKLIPFTVTIPDEKRRPMHELMAALEAEISGILFWAIQGFYKWQNDGGLKTPAEIVEATEAYRTEMDTLGGFVDEHLTIERTERVASTEVFNRYKEWCDKTGEYKITQRSFARKMQERGFVLHKDSNHKSWWMGVLLVDHTQKELEFLTPKEDQF